MGVALGLFVGLVVPLGLQVAAALLLAFPLRADKLLSVLFTFILNPWTATVYYPAVCLFGAWLLGDQALSSDATGKFMAVMNAPSLSDSWTRFWNLGSDLALAYTAAVSLLAAVICPPSYFAAHWIVSRHRRLRREARTAKINAQEA